MRLLTQSLFLVIGLTVTATAGAWDRDYRDYRGDYDIPSLERRLEHQDHAIREGLRRGELTPREAHRLEREQEDIRHLLRMMERDGHLSPRERDRLNDLLDRSRAHIKEERREGSYRNW